MSARPLPSPVSLQRLLRGPGVWQDPFFGATSYLLQDPQSVVPTDLSGNGVTHTNFGTVALSTGGPWSLKGLTFARNTATYSQRVELGTGIYAEGGGGRPTPWVYQDAKGNWHYTRGNKAQPFLKPAAADHAGQYRDILESELKNG